jgi:hypothetical protein
LDVSFNQCAGKGEKEVKTTALKKYQLFDGVNERLIVKDHQLVENINVH